MSPRLLSYILRHRRVYLGGFLLGIASSALLMLDPVVLRVAVDGIGRRIGPRALLGYAGVLVAIHLAVWVLRYYWRLLLLGEIGRAHV